MGQEIVQLIDGIRRDASEHLAEPFPGIDLQALTAGNERPRHRCRLAAVVAAEEGPVIPATAIPSSDLSAALLSISGSAGLATRSGCCPLGLMAYATA
jgi:hypothetical protein